jgi:ATP-dependent DNA helicase DinG
VSSSAHSQPLLSLDQAFAKIAGALAGYEVRAAQLEMARAIHRGFAEKMPVVAEAGTGTGKSFAALVPAVLTGKRVVISTATIALQEQYLYKDIPLLQKALGIPFTAQLVKGRGHYLSKRRWDEYLLAQATPEEFRTWVDTSLEGDWSELKVQPSHELWDEVRSDGDDCLRERCPHFSECFYFQSRRNLAQTQILVTNHALLLMDWATSRQLLPPYDFLVVDEAHQFAEYATRTLTLEFSNFGLRRTLKRIRKQFAQVELARVAVEQIANQVFARVLENPSSRSLDPDPLDLVHLHQKITALQKNLLSLNLKEKDEEKNLESAVSLMRRDRLSDILAGYLGHLHLLMHPSPEWVSWQQTESTRTGTKAAFSSAPLDLASQLQSWFFSEDSPTSVWTSATLTTGGSDPFAYFRAQVGLEPQKALELKFSSPFNFKEQALLYLPRHLPDPNQPTFNEQVALEVEKLVNLSQGRAFVLFTSMGAMLQCYEALAEKIPWPSHHQKQMPKRQLLEWFRSTPNPVLFATNSFWEGVSVDGPQLSLVIIDRIPFQSPGDPVYDARCEQLKQGGDTWAWFTALALPYASLRLKQGFGRLIRSRQDRGVVAILDPRMTRKGYGKTLSQSLPELKVVHSLDPIVLKSYLSTK